jgi:shikimate dehydrogenase
VTRASGSYMGFVGVSTGGSSIRTVFPEWADALALPTRTLVGHDVPLDSPPEVYRDVVTTIRDDPEHWGALVTTHKMAVHSAARDLFDACDDLAETFGEISCIAKRGDRLVGSAKDPVTARLAVEEFVAPDHFATGGGEALILGTGGAGTALSHQLGVRGDRPGRITCTALSQEPLDHARAIHERAGLPADLVR